MVTNQLNKHIEIDIRQCSGRNRFCSSVCWKAVPGSSPQYETVPINKKYFPLVKMDVTAHTSLCFYCIAGKNLCIQTSICTMEWISLRKWALQCGSGLFKLTIDTSPSKTDLSHAAYTSCRSKDLKALRYELYILKLGEF